MGKAKVWKSRQALVRGAMARHPLQNLHRLLKQASAVERVVKGATPGDPWQELTVLVAGLAGSSRSQGRAAA
jgi:DNA polymerase-3 subunit delta